MNFLEIVLLGYLVTWPFYVTIELHRLDMFMRSRYRHPISRLQFFAELTGRFLLISFLTSLSVDWYVAGLSEDATSAENYDIWQLHVLHTCMLRGLAIMRFMRTHISRPHPGLLLQDEVLSFAFVATVAYIYASAIVIPFFHSAGDITPENVELLRCL
jgi:hypothetical protein